MAKRREKRIAVRAVRPFIESIIDDLVARKLDRVILTRNGKPVAALVPIDQSIPDPWGAMRGTVYVMPGVDLTAPTGEIWEAKQEDSG